MAKKYRAKKYMGDDQYSWAVFRAEDVRGVVGVIFDSHITPIVSGCSRTEASYYIDKFEKEDRQRATNTN